MEGVPVPSEEEEDASTPVLRGRRPPVVHTELRREPAAAKPEEGEEGEEETQVDNSACAGLIFCKLAKGGSSSSSKSRLPSVPRDPAPVVINTGAESPQPDFIGFGSESLIDLVCTVPLF